MGLRRFAVAALGICLTATACSPAHYEVDTGATSLVLSIDTYGGMPQRYGRLVTEPELVLYGDGLVIVSCMPQWADAYPVLACLNQARLRADEVQKILATADWASLLGPDRDYSAIFITDATTTVFKTTVGGKTHTVSAYALDASASSSDPSVEAIRRRLRAFRNGVENLPSFTGRAVEMTPYTGTALRVRATAVQSPDQAEMSLARKWPLAGDPISEVEGGLYPVTLTGSDMAVFVSAAEGATTATLWNAPGGYYMLSATPLYPGETAD